MKVLRILVIFLLTFGLFTAALPARAEINANFVKEFLNRYRPGKIPVPGTPGEQLPQDVGTLISTGQMPLSVSDLINLMLQNNLDITVNRLTPLSVGYISQTYYRPFEPTITLS